MLELLVVLLILLFVGVPILLGVVVLGTGLMAFNAERKLAKAKLKRING